LCLTLDQNLANKNLRSSFWPIFGAQFVTPNFLIFKENFNEAQKTFQKGPNLKRPLSKQWDYGDQKAAWISNESCDEFGIFICTKKMWNGNRIPEGEIQWDLCFRERKGRAEFLLHNSFTVGSASGGLAGWEGPQIKN